MANASMTQVQTIQMVDIGAIKMAPFNPPNRTEQRRIKRLKESIEKIGLLYPLLLTPDHQIIDGHRRFTCLKALNWPAVPALIHDGPLEEMWAHTNSYTEPIKASSWVQTVNSGFPVDKVPSKFRALIETTIELIGRDGLATMAAAGKSTDVTKQALNAARYLDEDSNEMKAKILRWIIDNNMSFALHNFIVARQPSELLYEAIETNKKLAQGWAIV